MSSPFIVRDPNVPTPTKWLTSFEYVANSTPVRITAPPPLLVPTPDSHTKRVTDMAVSIDRTMESLLRPFDATPRAEDKDKTHATSLQANVPVVATPLHTPLLEDPFPEPVQMQADLDVKEVPADKAKEEAHADNKEGHKALYKRAKEQVELLAHGGLEMFGRGRSGTASMECSGYRYDLACTHRTTSKCPARCVINSDFSVDFIKGHNAPTPHPTAPNVFLPGTGCPRYGKFRGLHASEVRVAIVHDTAAARTTNAKDLSLKILAQKVKDKTVKPEDRKAEDHIPVKPEDGVELPNLFEKAPPTRRAIRHWIHAYKTTVPPRPGGGPFRRGWPV